MTMKSRSSSNALIRAFDLACRARGDIRIHSSSRSSVFWWAEACFSSVARRVVPRSSAAPAKASSNASRLKPKPRTP